jgi:hypothetical protein
MPSTPPHPPPRPWAGLGWRWAGDMALFPLSRLASRACGTPSFCVPFRWLHLHVVLQFSSILSFYHFLLFCTRPPLLLRRPTCPVGLYFTSSSLDTSPPPRP